MVTYLLPSSVVQGWGLSDDKQDAPDLLVKGGNVNHPGRLDAYACSDADWVGQFCREARSVESVIKLAVHLRDGGLNGEY